MFCGFLRKVWKIPHSPCPVVAPNDGGCWSDMSNTTDFACDPAADLTTPPTKPASNTIAPFDGEPNAFVTESLNPYWSAPLDPPAMLPVSPTIFAIVFRAVVTDGSVHLILCAESALYL